MKVTVGIFSILQTLDSNLSVIKKKKKTFQNIRSKKLKWVFVEFAGHICWDIFNQKPSIQKQFHGSCIHWTLLRFFSEGCLF